MQSLYYQQSVAQQSNDCTYLLGCKLYPGPGPPFAQARHSSVRILVKATHARKPATLMHESWSSRLFQQCISWKNSLTNNPLEPVQAAMEESFVSCGDVQ